MAVRTIGIIVNGATGRIASTQHLQHALIPIAAEGGIVEGEFRIVPKPLLVGRDEGRLSKFARTHGLSDWTTDLDAALSDPQYSVFFDAAPTHQRQAAIARAIEAGKHIYSEKPVARSVADGLALLRNLKARGLKHGAVEDKQYLPGFRKLAALSRAGFFGRLTSFKLEFGWWVFDGIEQRCQRPSWNYQRAGGGGILFDMFPHWRYLVESVVGPIRRLAATAATAVPQRVDENGRRYEVDVEDTTAVLVELECGAIGTILSSWATRVRRDDLLTFHVDGSGGSAVAGVHRCHVQAARQTPRIDAINPAVDLREDYFAGWNEVPDDGPYKNPYRVGWEDFLRHLVVDTPMRCDFAAGIRDIQLAEACHRSISGGGWVDLDHLGPA